MTNQLITLRLDDNQLKYTGKDFNYLLQQLEAETDENYSLKIVNLIKYLVDDIIDNNSVNSCHRLLAIDIIKMISRYDIDELNRYSETLSELFRDKNKDEVMLVCQNYWYAMADVHRLYYTENNVEQELLRQIDQLRTFAEVHGYPIADDLAVEYDYYKREFEFLNQR